MYDLGSNPLLLISIIVMCFCWSSLCVMRSMSWFNEEFMGVKTFFVAMALPAGITGVLFLIE